MEHLDDEELTCNVCDRAFSSPRQLEYHQQKKRHWGYVFFAAFCLRLHKYFIADMCNMKYARIIASGKPIRHYMSCTKSDQKLTWSLLNWIFQISIELLWHFKSSQNVSIRLQRSITQRLYSIKSNLFSTSSLVLEIIALFGESNFPKKLTTFRICNYDAIKKIDSISLTNETLVFQVQHMRFSLFNKHVTRTPQRFIWSLVRRRLRFTHRRRRFRRLLSFRWPFVFILV